MKLCHVSSFVAAAAAARYDKSFADALQGRRSVAGVMSTNGWVRKFPKCLSRCPGDVMSTGSRCTPEEVGALRGVTCIGNNWLLELS